MHFHLQKLEEALKNLSDIHQTTKTEITHLQIWASAPLLAISSFMKVLNRFSSTRASSVASE